MSESRHTSNLAGFANFATAWAANAYFRDAGANGEATGGKETYVVLCAKGDIDAGVEIRIDYNFGSQGVGTFHHYLTVNCGVPKHEAASRVFREAVWKRPQCRRSGVMLTTVGRTPLEAAWPAVYKGMATRRRRGSPQSEWQPEASGCREERGCMESLETAMREREGSTDATAG